MPGIKNVLVIMCDHHRFDALSCLGNPLAHTPHLDRLCERSVRLESAYCQAPVCSPTRHSLATGRYVHAHGVYGNHTYPYPGMYTIAHHLAPHGIRRFSQGHMHWASADTDHGYEPSRSKADFMSRLSPASRERYEWESQGITRRTTGGPSPRTKEEYWGWDVAQESIERMEEAVAKGEPFLNWTAFTEPHPPWYPPREFYDLIDQSAMDLPAQAPVRAAPPHPYVIGKQQEWLHLTDVEARQVVAGYYGMVALVDSYIGMVLDAVDRLGIRDETAIIWTSDHGEQAWEHGLFTKFCMYEASVHVPMVISLPGAKPGVRDGFVEHVDVFPTICDLFGIDVPDGVQGRSMLSLAETDETPSAWRKAVFSQIGTLQMIRTRDWKLNVYGGEPGDLYDLNADPAEFHNLVADPAYSEVRDRMLDALRDWAHENRPC